MKKSRLCLLFIVAAALLARDASAQTENYWLSSGQDVTNSRNQPSENTISSGNVQQLVQQWVFTTAGDVTATPTVADDAIYFPDFTGNLFAINKSGKLIWSHKISDYDGVVGSISRVSPVIDGDQLIIGDILSLTASHNGANVMAIDRNTGALRWITQVDAHQAALITGSPVVVNNMVLQGISSNEEGLATENNYPCCTFRGSLVALDDKTGKLLWKTYDVPDNGGQPGQYSGGAIWQPPAVDLTRGLVYVGTGNNYSAPQAVETCEENAINNDQPYADCTAANDYFDSALALDLQTGAIKWGTKLRSYDVWNVNCLYNPVPASCPVPPGPDYDLGGSGPNALPNIVGFGEKSGVYWALNPDTGKLVWSTAVGPGGSQGGIQWGTATDGNHIFVAIANINKTSYQLLSGQVINWGFWSALDAATGKILWQTADPTSGSTDIGAVSTANGLVYAGSYAGYMYAMDAPTGKILWGFNSGGTVIDGPSIVDGHVYWGSGYGRFAPGTGNNKVYAFGLPDYAVSSSISSQTVAAGSSTSYPLTVTSEGGFSGSVTLAASGLPTGATATFTSNPVTGGSGTSTLQISTSRSVVAGTYTVTISGASGTLVNTTTVQLVITGGATAASAISVNFVGNSTAMAATESAGVVAETNWNQASGATGTGLALINASGAASGASVTWHSDNTWSMPIASTAGNYHMMQGYLDNGNGDPSTVTVSGLPASSTGYNVYVYADGSNGAATRSASYQISGTGITTTAITLTDAANANFSGTFTQAHNSAGNYVLFTIGPSATGFTITATPGSNSDGASRAPINGVQIVPATSAVPSFAISSSVSSQTVAGGSSTSYPLTVTSQGGFSGSVTLAVSGLPAGATPTFTANPVTGGSGTSTLQISTTASTVSGTYTLAISGTSAALVASTNVQLVITGGSTPATAISINFVGNGTTMAATESAGVVAETNWNQASGATGSGLALLSSTASSTGATLTWKADNTWSTSITNTAGNNRMMLGYLDNGNADPTTATVSGLPGSATGYNVYVYAEGANGSATRDGIYQISGAGITTSSVTLIDSGNTSFSGTFTQAINSAGNYVEFTIPAGVTGFTITATPSTTSDGAPRAPINGIQIVSH